MNLDHLPKQTSISGGAFLKWERLWRPLDAPNPDENWSETDFLQDPNGNNKGTPKGIDRWIGKTAGCWVLCGSPGSGKSGAIRLWLDALKSDEPDTFVMAVTPSSLSGVNRFDVLINHPLFQAASTTGKRIVLVIDGFDQFRSEAGLPFEALAFAISTLTDRSRLTLVIGCRVRDWDQNCGASLFDLWPVTEKRYAVLEICPLSPDEIAEAAGCRVGLSPDSFLRTVREKRLDEAARWPFSLRSLLDTYESTGGLDLSMSDQYSNTISLLLKDQNAPVRAHDPEKANQLRQLARRIAAILVFGGKQGLSQSHVEEDDSLVTAGEITGSPTIAREVLSDGIFNIDGAVIHEVLGTALFVAIRPPTEKSPIPALGFTHHGYAELLAAEYIQRLNLEQLVSLLTVSAPSGSRVPPQLVEVASWLAISHETWFNYLLRVMPEILLRADGGQFSTSQKQQLTDSLLEKVASWDAAALEEVRLLTPDFKFPGLADKLRPSILDSKAPEMLRIFAIEMVAQCRIAELEEELWILLEREDTREPRPFATHALYALLMGADLGEGTVRKLQAALKGQMGPDKDDQIKGMALLCLVPRYLKPSEITSYLTIPKQDFYFGAYKRLLREHLPPLISESNLVEFLQLGAATPSIFHTETDGKNLAQAVLQAFARVPSPTSAMKQAFAGWFYRCVQRYASLPIKLERYGAGTAANEDIIVDKETRCKWLRYALEFYPVQQVPHYISMMDSLHLRELPLVEALAELDASAERHRPFWSQAVRSAMYPMEERSANLPALLSLYNRFPELREALGECGDRLNIHETYVAADVRFEAEEKARKSELAAKQTKDVVPSRREHFAAAFTRWKEGDEIAWFDLWTACAIGEDGRCYEWGGDFVRDWKGWKSLSPDEQAEVYNCARTFLLRRDDPRRREVVYSTTGWSEKGTAAVGLLVQRSTADSELNAAITEKWIGAWFRHYSNISDRACKVAGFLYQLNSQTTVHALHNLFLSENAAEHSCRSIELLKPFWDSRLSEAFASWLCADDVGPMMLKSGLKFLAEQDAESALLVIQRWLHKLTADDPGDERRRVVVFCALFYTRGKLFNQAYGLLIEYPTPKHILCLVGGHFEEAEKQLFRETLEALTASQLAGLAVLMANAFPSSGLRGESDEEDSVPPEDNKDPEARPRFLRASPDHHEAYLLSREIAARFAEIATPAELDAVRAQFPESRSMELPFARNSALKQISQAQWQPVAPEIIIRLAQSNNARLIRTNDDLLDFIMLRLQAFEEQRWDLAGQHLWNENDGQPTTAKNEETLSNELKRWLDKDWQLVVNREVQPIEIMPNRLDLKIDIPGQPALCVIIEVKKAENLGVLTSMQTQLIDRYLIAGRQTHGIYLVGYFEDKPSPFGTKSIEEVKQRLESIRQNAIMPKGTRIETLLMDFRHPKRLLRKHRKPKRK